MAHLEVRVFGRSLAMQHRDGAPVDVAGRFGKATLESGCSLYFLGPCVLFAARAIGGRGEPRLELELGRFALSFC